MKIQRFHGALLALAAGTLLAACGGGGSDAPPAQDPNAPPASAGASSQGFLAYIAGLAGGMFDNAEPIDVSMFSAPTDNTEAQAPVATAIDQ